MLGSVTLTRAIASGPPAAQSTAKAWITSSENLFREPMRSSCGIPALARPPGYQSAVFGAQSAPLTVPLSVAAPGIFTLNGSGKGQGAVLNQDYLVNGPANPAARGSVVIIYATGIGATSPCVDGQIYESNFPQSTLPVVVGIGNIGAQVLYAGQAPFLVSGVAQINVVVPNDAPVGVVPLSFAVNGVLVNPE